MYREIKPEEKQFWAHSHEEKKAEGEYVLLCEYSQGI